MRALTLQRLSEAASAIRFRLDAAPTDRLHYRVSNWDEVLLKSHFGWWTSGWSQDTDPRKRGRVRTQEGRIDVSVIIVEPIDLTPMLCWVPTTGTTAVPLTAEVEAPRARIYQSLGVNLLGPYA